MGACTTHACICVRLFPGCSHAYDTCNPQLRLRMQQHAGILETTGALNATSAAGALNYMHQDYSLFCLLPQPQIVAASGFGGSQASVRGSVAGAS